VPSSEFCLLLLSSLRAGLISEEALHYLATAHIALSDALYHMKLAVGDDG